MAALPLVAACKSGTSPARLVDGGVKARLLVVTHTTGFRHTSIPTAEGTLGALARESGAFEVDYARTASEVEAKLSPAALTAYDGFFFANTTGNIGIPDLGALLRQIEAGRALLGAHSASDTYHDAPVFLEALGGEFLTHGAQTEVEVKVENAWHPSVAHLAPAFRIYDEIYEFKSNPRPNVQVLLALDRHPADGHPEAGQPGDFPIAWYRVIGRGRVFYTALGHREEVWEDGRFQRHLLGGIQWALGLER